MLLQGKVAIVTGGTRGIGRAIVEKFLEHGAKVVLWGSKEETVQRALKEIKMKNPTYEIFGMHPNLLDAKEVESAIDAVKQQQGSIDILVNNAGISQSTPLYDYKIEDFDKIIKLNVNAVFYTIVPTAKIMKEQGGGVILNTSSMVSFSGQPSGVGYPVSKFAINGLTISLARELAKDGIRVNAVAPGVTMTDMVAALPKPMLEGIASTIPMGRIADPDEVADAFLYLASDFARYVTGEILSVDGACRA